MPVRVTQSMMNMQLVRSLSNNMRRMDEWNTQLTTGRKINKPSDDPVGITYSLRYRSDLAANEQYQTNVDNSLSYLEYSDKMLSQAGDVLQRLNELAVKASNGTNPQSALDAIKSEVDELKKQMLDIANSQLNGKYIFNGQKTDIKPYADEATASSVVTDPYLVKLEISQGVEMATNITGNDVFGLTTDNDNVFKIMDELSTALSDPADFDAINDSIGKIETRMNQFLGVRADLGARINRVELVQTRLEDINLNLKSLQSKTEDADVAEVYTNLTMAENVYQASLSVGAKLIQPTLVDFLR
ncbi:flagellar hook-associated protein FlgL [Marinicrinis lubricantis]|uniref:Flagellar hook-associated protein FlgL n=1 Tax=Marinicrinis lubricantis TaxID=2086470 RepID=A0ABW1IT24_9BACL